jgi:adenylate kinase family enzyme
MPLDNKLGILVCGMNGAGKTTLARALARRLGYTHMDAEDYYFLPAEIPYTRERPRAERNALLLADMNAHPRFVFSAVTGGAFGDAVVRKFDIAVLIDAPRELRMARIEQREAERFGNRVLPGGDMPAQQARFHAFAAARPEDLAENWVKSLTCPVLRVDGVRSVDALVNELAAR